MQFCDMEREIKRKVQELKLRWFDYINMRRQVNRVMFCKSVVMGKWKEKNGKKKNFWYILKWKTVLLNKIVSDKASFFNLCPYFWRWEFRSNNSFELGLLLQAPFAYRVIRWISIRFPSLCIRMSSKYSSSRSDGSNDNSDDYVPNDVRFGIQFITTIDSIHSEGELQTRWIWRRSGWGWCMFSLKWIIR